MASRFVIEYVVAQLPLGVRPLSMDFYDRLQGIANHLVNFGFESDLIFFNLADIKLSVLHQVDLVSRETCLLKLGRNIWTTLRFAYDVEEMMARGTRVPSEKPD